MMKQAGLLFLLIVALAFASCGSDEPRYADPEAHEKTVQLNEQYGPLMVGTWHYENISDTQRYFECLTFQAEDSGDGFVIEAEVILHDEEHILRRREILGDSRGGTV